MTGSDSMNSPKTKNNLPVIPSNMDGDLHHMENLHGADLVLFVAGNQFMVMPELLAAFQQQSPEIKTIFYETLPPGMELKQILAGGAIFQDRVIDVIPDIYASVNESAMHVLEEADLIEKEKYFLYLHNRIVLMVPEGNPARIASVHDLGRDEVRISQPNPETEDIALHIIGMYRETGGETLVKRIMEEKRAEGTAIFTIVHHRETPLRLKKRTVDVGPVWATEYINARREGLMFECIEPGQDMDQRDKIDYFITVLKNAPNPSNAAKFLDFIKSDLVRNIYNKYGFVPHFV
ncbi:MAG: substrate-binding domain-containing protein [Desulfovibrionales bacterium]|nr:substrate-binding domain-containing protein [Desulfovibrionales bacterium]